MNIERLNILADYLDTVRSEDFEFGTLVNVPDGEDFAGIGCGTTGCAIGHLPMIPEFAALGIKYKQERSIWRPEPRIVIRDGYYEQWDDVAGRLFDLDNKDVNYLFCPNTKAGTNDDTTAQEVAAHIRAFIARGGMP